MVYSANSLRSGHAVNLATSQGRPDGSERAHEEPWCTWQDSEIDRSWRHQGRAIDEVVACRQLGSVSSNCLCLGRSEALISPPQKYHGTSLRFFLTSVWSQRIASF